MTATDELRRLLTAAGVEWWPLDGTPDMTECIVDGVRHKYRPVGRGIIWSSCTEVAMKPEQAIAATLGATDAKPTQTESSGTCEYCNGKSFDGQTVMISNHGWQRINFCPNCGRRIEVDDG